MPAGAQYLWDIFARLSRRRGSTGFGPAALTWLDMDAFQRVAGVRLQQWEVEVIEMLDDLWLGALSPKKD